MTVSRYKASATEAEMLKAITDAITIAGGVWYRVNDARMQKMAGFPDVMAFVPYAGSDHDIQLVGLEIKTRRDRQRHEQLAFLDCLNRTVHCRGEIVRAGEPKQEEIDLDHALEIIGGEWL
jgi:hypothetical protein